MRRFWFGTNLKMHQTPQQSREYVRQLRRLLADVPDVESAMLWLIPPFTSIGAIADECREANILVGAQNMHWADEGAYTGEISPVMLKACGAQFVMLGHAERRTLFGETDEVLNKKVLAAARHGLDIMLCVGESASHKQFGVGDEFLAQQLKIALHGFKPPPTDVIRGRVAVLYEPLWSVGSGGTAADPDFVSHAFENIRHVLISLFGDAGKFMPILYGGSVDATNCAEYARLPHASGMGVGRAGLNVDNFIRVFTNALAAWAVSKHRERETEKEGKRN